KSTPYSGEVSMTPCFRSLTFQRGSSTPSSLSSQNLPRGVHDNRRTKGSRDSNRCLVFQRSCRFAGTGRKKRAVRSNVQGLRRVVVHHKRIAAASVRTGNGCRNAMKVLIGNFKDYCPVEPRLHDGFLAAAVMVPQLELSPVLV